MSYGHGNSRRLRHIVDQLGRYVRARIQGSRKLLARPASQSFNPPPPLKLAFLRGEALLTLRFVAWCESLDLGLADDPANVWVLHQKLIADRGRILDLVNRIGLFSAVSRQTTLPQQEPELAYRLYCGLLDDLERGEEFRLLEIATDFLFLHAFRGLFPDRAVARPDASSAEGLRAGALSRLRKHFKQAVEIKESFRQAEDSVEFRLRLKLRERWHDLPPHSGKRLKPTRLAAWQHLLDTLKRGEMATLIPPESLAGKMSE